MYVSFCETWHRYAKYVASYPIREEPSSRRLEELKCLHFFLCQDLTHIIIQITCNRFHIVRLAVVHVNYGLFDTGDLIGLQYCYLNGKEATESMASFVENKPTVFHWLWNMWYLKELKTPLSIQFCNRRTIFELVQSRI